MRSIEGVSSAILRFDEEKKLGKKKKSSTYSQSLSLPPFPLSSSSSNPRWRRHKTFNDRLDLFPVLLRGLASRYLPRHSIKPVVRPVKRQSDGRGKQPLSLCLTAGHSVFNLVDLLRPAPLCLRLPRRRPSPDESSLGPSGKPAVHRRDERLSEAVGVSERAQRGEIGPDDGRHQRNIDPRGSQRVVRREPDARGAVCTRPRHLGVGARPRGRDVELERW